MTRKATLNQALFVLLCFGMQYVWCTPDGPPMSACEDMQPRQRVGEMGMEGHTEPDQSKWPTEGRSTHPPYYITITLTVETYEPGATYNGKKITT